MWFFTSSRTTFADSGVLEGMTDCHSHILPGVDDGIQTLPEALHALKAYAQWGIREVWLTPHVMEDYPNRTASLEKHFGKLVAACGELPETSGITLRLGSENMLDSLFADRLAAGDLLPVIDGKHLLVETSYYNPPVRFRQLLTSIIEKGFVPVLAHPERYCYMDLTDYDELRAMGVRLQLNLTSIVGAYGEEAREKSCRLLKKRAYSFVGSDLHRLASFLELMNIPVRRKLVENIKRLEPESTRPRT